ncbi:pyridoxal 5'-phosphate synthase glutaminase subunit PdxT [bacterium]|nr:pyridoxal 5'-phosphate synthase glutaminase subunit PdxT [bacterium]
MKQTIGVLALQGDFELHRKSLKRIGIHSKTIYWPEDLDDCEGLILPGGESTTFMRLLEKTGLSISIMKFSKERCVMGTCAGLIALATRVTNDSLKTLGLIEMDVERNGYGRQIDSFIDKIRVPILNGKSEFEGVFIRAPKIHSLGSKTEALGFHGEEIVMARNEQILVTTFHPELTKDQRIHQYFIEKMVNA